jgi:HEAT repeat protein
MQMALRMSTLNWTKLIEDLRNYEDASCGSEAYQIIASTADEADIPQLYSLLNHEDALVRDAMAEPLVRLEGTKALPALLQALQRGWVEGADEDGLQSTIAELLEMNKQTAAPMLLTMLTEQDTSTRANAAWALGFGIPEITPIPLLNALHDKDAEVRAAAAGSLGSFENNPEVCDALTNQLADTDKQVVIAAISALGYLGDKRALVPLRRLKKSFRRNIRQAADSAIQQLLCSSS